MIDFSQNTFFKLKQTDREKGDKLICDMLVDGETVLSVFQELRDYVIFTDRRVVAVNVQDVTGKKKNFSFLPYAKISAFAVESAGVLDVDSRLDMWFSGLGHVRFDFTGRSDVVIISRTIAKYVLGE